MFCTNAFCVNYDFFSVIHYYFGGDCVIDWMFKSLLLNLQPLGILFLIATSSL
jgi:hypothetical protein